MDANLVVGYCRVTLTVCVETSNIFGFELKFKLKENYVRKLKY